MEIPRPFLLRFHASQVSCVRAATSGDRALAGDVEGIVALWNLDTRRVVASVRAHEGGALSVHWISRDPIDFLSHGRDGVARRWSLVGDQLECLATAQTWCASFCVSDSLDRLLCCSDDEIGKLCLFDFDKDPVDVVALEDVGEKKRGVCMAASILNRETQLGVFEDGSVRCYFKGREVSRYDVGSSSEVPLCLDAARVFKDQWEVVVGTVDGSLVSLRLDVETKSFSLTTIIHSESPASCVCVDENLIVAAYGDSRIRLYSTKTHELLCVLQNSSSVTSLDVFRLPHTPHSYSVLAGGKEKRISHWRRLF